ncbi:MAG: M14 family zinc carboxypeptidase [Bacteroidia bacterium]|nr:M14 family zinc carboxypeptidase [Bacteroidia bacterium]
MHRLLWMLVCSALSLPLAAQPSLAYYLPGHAAFDPAVPAPDRLLGYQVGEWHVSHDQLVRCMERMDAASPRVRLDTIGYTYERRPLIHLIITSPANQARIEELRTAHLRLSDPSKSAGMDLSRMPAVVNLGFSVHGNEASGSNAALLLVYALAAARDAETLRMLDELIILVDPALNPDGLQRFSAWVNMHKGLSAHDTDPQGREHQEAWPRGRTNHYWFDLNRDWLPAQLPESQARLARFHEWKPNFLTDHHEMGSNATFFFQPGVPSRNHPLIPAAVGELTRTMAGYYARALDQIGSLYYSQEDFDDFYFGKGSTYPDLNGGVGVLFEQASSRGHAQQTPNGLLEFPFAIRNHLTAARAVLQGCVEHRVALLEHQRMFYQQAVREGEADARKAFAVALGRDRGRAAAFIELLKRHGIEASLLARTVEADGIRFPADSSLLIPLAQPQYRLVRAMLETQTSFTDSLFYDISSWTLPLAFHLPYAPLEKRYTPALAGAGIRDLALPGPAGSAQASYAYALAWDQYLAPRTLNRLLGAGLLVRAATRPFAAEGGRIMEAGTVIIPVAGQPLAPAQLHQLMLDAARADGAEVIPLSSGYTGQVQLGSSYFRPVVQPRAALLVDGDAAGYETGEVWHLLDQRYRMPLTLLPVSAFGQGNLSRFNVIIMADGSYGSLDAGRMQEFLRNGGTLIAMQGALRWLSDHGIGGIKVKPGSRDAEGGAYSFRDREYMRGAQEVGGVICRLEADLTHPLCFGLGQAEIPVFRSSPLVLNPSGQPWATPLRYPAAPVLSGYLSRQHQEAVSLSAGAVVARAGSGRVIAIADNPNFRAFWYGTNRIFANALFFSALMD